MRGIIRSSRIRCGVVRAILSRATRPSAATTTSYPSSARMVSSVPCNPSSSSTTRTVLLTPSPPVGVMRLAYLTRRLGQGALRTGGIVQHGGGKPGGVPVALTLEDAAPVDVRCHDLHRTDGVGGA